MEDRSPLEDRGPLEKRADVESLAYLQAARREIMTHLAPLAAEHGENGHWDAHRRAQRGVIATEIRAGWSDPKAPTEAVVEDRACAEARYLALLEEGREARIKFLELDNQLLEITERIRSRELELGVYAAELQQMPSRVRVSSYTPSPVDTSLTPSRR